LAKKNLGPGGNRNRVIGKTTAEVIWFLDSDMIILSENPRVKIEEIFRKNKNQIVGTLIKNLLGENMPWNFGKFMNPVRDAYFNTALAFADSENRAKISEMLAKNAMDFSWISWLEKPPKRCKIDWVAEGSFLISREIFEKLGGYDSRFLYHEGQDFCFRAREKNLDVVFDPAIEVLHNSIESRSATHAEIEREARFLFFKEHWQMSRDIFEKLFAEIDL
jgi:GT2 family glycosyltransferase